MDQHLHDVNQMPYLAKAITRILVIDDDANVARAIQAILARHQCDTVIASRAHAGIHAFQASQFDLVMVDLFMPARKDLTTITQFPTKPGFPSTASPAFPLPNSLVPVRNSPALPN